jgi:hypothetical protein
VPRDVNGSAVEGRAATLDRAPHGALIIAAYAVLGGILCWSRLFQLGHSFWTDEIIMVRGYVRGGLDVIFTGSALNHQLMALLAWAMSAVTGESEIAFRLLSVAPFLAGVVLMTAWLHRRHGALSGVLFLFLATNSPLLLDITRQARGYGLAFMSMCVVIVAALQALRTGRTWLVAAMCAAGVIGSWTLPQFAIAFGATCVAVALERSVRRATVVGLAVSMALIYAWYAFHSGAVEAASQIEDGVRIGFPWIVTAPIDQILLPALIWIDGTALVAGLVWLPLVGAVIVIAAASPLLRVRSSALVLGSGMVASILVLWVTDAYVIPRYLSFLVVPWFVALATGAATLLSGVGERRAPVRTVLCLIVLAALAAQFAVLAPDVVGLPREANRDAARVVDERETSTPVIAYMRNPGNLVFYLERQVDEPEQEDLESSVCEREAAVYYVFQPFALDPVEISCLRRPGVEHHRFRQYARGDEMNVWFVPPGR